MGYFDSVAYALDKKCARLLIRNEEKRSSEIWTFVILFGILASLGFLLQEYGLHTVYEHKAPAWDGANQPDKLTKSFLRGICATNKYFAADTPCFMYFGNDPQESDGCNAALKNMIANYMPFCVSDLAEMQSNYASEEIVMPICKCGNPNVFTNDTWARASNVVAAVKFTSDLTGAYTIHGKQEDAQQFAVTEVGDTSNIRWNVNITAEAKTIASTYNNIITLQVAMDAALISQDRGVDTDISLGLEYFPQQPFSYTDMNFVTMLPQLITILTMSGFTTIATEMAKETVDGLRHMLYTIGCSPLDYWLSWFRIMSFRALITMIPMLIMCKELLITEMDTGLLLLCLIIFNIWAMLFAIFLSLMRMSPDSSTIIVVMIPSLVAALSYAYTPWFNDSNYNMVIGKSITILLAVLFPPFSMAMIILIAMLFTFRSQSLNFGSANEPADAFHNITCTHMILCLFFNTVALAGVDYYLAIKTSGIAAALGNQDAFDFSHEKLASVEEAGTGDDIAVSIKGLNKSFTREGGLFKAVDNLVVNFHKNQITSFLGHNGAGKSTTCALLTGEINADSGDAFIHGYSVANQMKDIRPLIGVCPQKNVIWDLLSPRDHLELYARLRNVPVGEATTQIEKLLKDIGLTDKANAYTKNLSGGQKRKLCTAAALIGNPPVVFLDEPTTGMDSSARRDMWDILFKYKKGRTIILCTHHMDEADILGDRVAILSAGKLQVSGTPEYLKAKYGKGVRIDVSMNEGADRADLLRALSEGSGSEAQLDMDGIIDNTDERERVKVEVLSDTKASDVHFKLGLDADVHSALDSLEKKRDQGAIEDFGITATNLEDVFWELGEIADQENVQKDHNSQLPDDLKLTPPSSGFKIYMMICRLATSFRREWMKQARNNFAVFLYLCLGIFFYSFSFDFSVSKPEAVNLTQNAFSGVNQPFGVAWSGSSSDFPTSNSVTNPKNIIDKMDKWSTADPEFPKPVDATGATPCLDAWLLGSDTTATCSVARAPSGDVAANTVDRGSLALVGSYEFATQPSLNTYQYTVLSNNTVALSLFGLVSYANSAIWSADEQDDSKRFSMSYFGWKEAEEGTTAIENHYRSLFEAYITALIGGLLFCMGICMMCGKASMGIVDDQKNRVRQMQILMGVTKVEYALSYLIWDNIQCVLLVLPLFFFCLIIDNSLALGATLLAIIVFFAAIVPLIHLISRLFDDSANSYGAIYYGLLLTFIGLFVCVQIFAGISWIMTERDYENSDADGYDDYIKNKDRAETFLTWSQLHPVFCLYEAFTAIVYAHKYGYNPLQADPEKFIISDPINGIVDQEMNTTIRTAAVPLTYLAVESIVFIAIYLGLEYFSDHAIFYEIDKVFSVLRQYLCRCVCINPLYDPNYGSPCMNNKKFKVLNIDADEDSISIEELSRSEIEDNDVRRERQECASEIAGSGIGISMVDMNLNPRAASDVESQGVTHDAIVAHGIRKEYNPTGLQRFEGTVAVQDFSLRVREKECLSLLGSNGAGKTSVMNMILRQARPSDGNIFVQGHNTRDILPDSVSNAMSYCPQQNTLFDALTARECLEFYCNIRGVPKQDFDRYVEQWMNAAELAAHEHTWCSHLSGGNKRKLSLAIALIGNPGLVILDEPTAGVDPSARRKLHWLINSTKRRGATVILTTHHIDEAATLGDRVAIMFKGYITCLGTNQHILHTYGEGYMLNCFMVESVSIDGVLLPAVKQHCPDMQIRDRSGTQFVQCHLGDSKKFSITSLYRTLERLKAEKKVEYFTCSQARLEDVFLKLSEKFVKKRSSDGEIP